MSLFDQFVFEARDAQIRGDATSEQLEFLLRWGP